MIGGLGGVWSKFWIEQDLGARVCQVDHF
jgi:hypothetical protein